MLDKNYEGIEQIYEEFCGYAHLSEKHYRSCSEMTSFTDGLAEFNSCISRHDRFIDDASYGNVANEFLKITNILMEELVNYFSKRALFPNNNLVPDQLSTKVEIST